MVDMIATWKTEWQAELRKQRADLMTAVAQIDAMLDSTGEPERPATSEDRSARPRIGGMSDAARKAASKRMKLYWKTRRAQQK